MANFTGNKIKDTFQRVLQVDGGNIQNGTGSLVDATINSLTASNGFVGNLEGTASQATDAAKLGGSDPSVFVTTSSFNNLTSSFNSYTSSTSDLLASLATTGSNTFNGNQLITGSLTVLQGATIYGSSSFVYVTASQLAVSESFISVNVFEPLQRFGGLKVYDSGSSNATASLVWDSLRNYWVYENASGSSYHGGMLLSGPRNVTGSLGDEPMLTPYFIPRSDGDDHLNDSQIYSSGSTTIITGSLTVTGTISGTTSNAVSASYAVSSSYTLNATSASYASVSTSASYSSNATSASYSLSASYASKATSASYASVSTSASYASTATSASYALTSSLSQVSLQLPDWATGTIYKTKDLVIALYENEYRIFRALTNFTSSGVTFPGGQTIAIDTNGYTGSWQEVSPLRGSMTGVTFSGSMTYAGSLTPAQINLGNNATVNDYNPTGLATTNFMRISSVLNVNISGIVAPSPIKNQGIYVVNIGTSTITLLNNDAGSSANNRFLLGTSKNLQQDEGIMLIYDDVSLRWRSQAIQI